jgi:hypothetical protein
MRQERPEKKKLDLNRLKPKMPEWLTDLDGDGAITQADLMIHQQMQGMKFRRPTDKVLFRQAKIQELEEGGMSAINGLVNSPAGKISRALDAAEHGLLGRALDKLFGSNK